MNIGIRVAKEVARGCCGDRPGRGLGSQLKVLLMDILPCSKIGLSAR